MPDEGASTSGEPALELRDLRKSFGAHVALDGISLTVPHGSIFGFLGPNGAGKTTTIRIVTGLARATSGDVRVLGRDVTIGARDVMARVGFLPDVPGFYDWMTGAEFLTYAGRLFGLGGSALRSRVDDLLDLAGLGEVRTRIGGYSRGMKQRLGIAQALVNAPELLILDEPTSALDPIGRRDVLQTVASLRGRATVFFSTHILGDVERTCDTVAILDRGRVVAQSGVAALKQRGGAPRVLLVTDTSPLDLAGRLRGAGWVVHAEVLLAGDRAGDPARDALRLTVTDASVAARELPRALADAGVGLVRLEQEEPSLEETFVQLVGGGP
ncbi:MAG TPA: ABC transporter ATP-binding protein [Gemmatimonadaceae bacterium]|nr:ABC transporter ATP-binding protein [Gemmatimonadaceae bacterium]